MSLTKSQKDALSMLSPTEFYVARGSAKSVCARLVAAGLAHHKCQAMFDSSRGSVVLLSLFRRSASGTRLLKRTKP